MGGVLVDYTADNATKHFTDDPDIIREIRNVILGLIGGVAGSFVLGLLGIQGHGLIGGTIVSVVGASILIWIGKKL